MSEPLKSENLGVSSFPHRRPDIEIVPVQVQPFAVDCRELRWWFAVPEVGEQTAWATYDPPEWTLTSVTNMTCVRKARVHDIEGVEIKVDEWDPEHGWQEGAWTMYARLTPNTVQWLATLQLRQGVRILRTFLENDFDQDWGEASRRLEDAGRYTPLGEGRFRLYEASESGNATESGIGAGFYSVRIGENEFTCLRVLELTTAPSPSEEGILVEAYLTAEGRTVLFRRYNGRRWRVGRGEPYDKPWDEQLPRAARLVINDVTFVHWYDCLTVLSVKPTNR